jgi:hypothetical protein
MSMFYKEDCDDDSIDDIRYMYEDELSMTQSASECSSQSSMSNLYENSPQSPECRQQPRRSLRKSLVQALTSPVKKARTSINHSTVSPSKRSSSKSLKGLKSPSRKSLSSKSLGKSWQEKYDLPPNTTRDQAMAVLLCRELEMMDI